MQHSSTQEQMAGKIYANTGATQEQQFENSIAPRDGNPKKISKLTECNDDGCCRNKTTDNGFGQEIDDKSEFKKYHKQLQNQHDKVGFLRFQNPLFSMQLLHPP